MEYLLKGYKPEILFHCFEDISRIPRGSGNEKGVADYLVAFAEARGLNYYRDEHHNVAIYRPASAGCEHKEKVMLQAHVDMVCEKLAGVAHDFEKDPLKLIEKDGMLTADGTTLGADDGAGVCLALAILDDKTLKTPAIECLFTVQEETGLGGAESFDYSRLSAKRIINLDTDLEGTAIASCAGSLNLSFLLDAQWIRNENRCMRISVSGLAGGHSGGDIHLGRRNAILLLGGLLTRLYEEQPFNLVALEGGNKRNAIPREAEAVIALPDRDGAVERVKELTKELMPLLVKEDRKLKVRAGRCAMQGKAMTLKDTSAVLSFLSLVPNGVIGMSASKPGLVETSSNLGVVRTANGQVDFSVYTRSSVDSEMDAVDLRMKRLSKVTGLRYVFCDRCPGWAFDRNSKLQKDYVEACKRTFPDAPPARVEAVHAGLECGIILEKMGGGDAISFGPNMWDIHTPNEKLDLHSTERIYRVLATLVQM